MRHRSLLILTTVLTTGALTLTACGSRDDDNKSDGNSSSGNTTVVIGVDAPLTGDLSALGLGIKNSADLAVSIANKKKLVPGVTFKVQPPRRPGPALRRRTERPEVHRQQGRPRRRRPAELQRLAVDAEAPQRRHPHPGLPPANTGTELTQGNDWKTGDKKRPPSRASSAPPPRTRSRAPSPRSTSTTTRRSSRST